jgi:hypothetical protein
MKIKCETCNEIHEIKDYVEKLPCGHILDRMYFYSRRVFFQVAGLMEDGLNLSQALDAANRSAARRYAKAMRKRASS